MDEMHILPNNVVSSSDTNLSCANVAAEDGFSLNGCSSEHSQNQENQVETKMEVGRPVCLTGQDPIEADNMLSLNDSQIVDEQSIGFDKNVPQDLLHSADNVSTGGEASESRQLSHPYVESRQLSHPYVPDLLGRETAPSTSHTHGSSSATTGGYDDRLESSLNGRQPPCKRKDIEVHAGQSAASGSSNSFHTSGSNAVVSVRSNGNTGIDMTRPSSYMPSARSSREELYPTRFSNRSRETAVVSYFPESSHRNFQARVNSAAQHDVYPHIYSSRDPFQNFSTGLPFNRTYQYRTVDYSFYSQGQHHIPAVPGFPQHIDFYPRDSAASNSKYDGSSNFLNSEEIFRTTREEAVRRTSRRSNRMDRSYLHDIRIFSEDMANWNPYSNSLEGPPMWLPHQNPSSWPYQSFPPRLAEDVQWTLPGYEGTYFNRQQSGHPATSQEAGHWSGSVSHVNQFLDTRSACSLNRQNDGFPLRSVVAGEGRRRLLQESVVMYDSPAFDHWVADHRGYDRHWNWRMNTDDMSYEQLLELGEKIGNVSTAPSEETISKCLKQQKYSLAGAPAATPDPEECCICQQPYVEGEDLGMIDCGHKFHTGCIKEWLLSKNVCPKCKAEALAT